MFLIFCTKCLFDRQIKNIVFSFNRENKKKHKMWSTLRNLIGHFSLLSSVEQKDVLNIDLCAVYNYPVKSPVIYF